MGNTMHYTKATGQSFGELRYDVWGAPTLSGKLQNNDNGNFVAATFTGHIYDTVLDIYFAEARFYDAKHRQWMSTDPIKDGLNWYQYVGSNPTTYFDPNGLDSIIITAKNAAGWQGHTSVIVEDKASGQWYYFYWGNKNIIFEVVTSESMKDLTSFNEWLNENGAGEDDWEKPFGYSSNNYTSATYIEGDFSASVDVFTKMIEELQLMEYYKKNGELKKRVNEYYSLFGMNCLHKSLDGMNVGLMADGETTFGDFLNVKSLSSLRPNSFRDYVKKIFANSSWDKNSAQEEIRKKLESDETDAKKYAEIIGLEVVANAS